MQPARLTAKPWAIPGASPQPRFPDILIKVRGVPYLSILSRVTGQGISLAAWRFAPPEFLLFVLSATNNKLFRRIRLRRKNLCCGFSACKARLRQKMETFGEQTFPFVSETGNWIFQFPAAKDAIHPRCKQREILADFVKKRFGRHFFPEPGKCAKRILPANDKENLRFSNLPRRYIQFERAC